MTKILFTSDWQLELDNLDTCQQVVDEIINKFLPVYKFKYLVHCGDVKRAYNPVDVRVVNFILRAITKFKQAGLEVYFVLGNHDRVGMHVDKQNWFPVLRKAGAYAADEPERIGLGDCNLAFLPFRNSQVLNIRDASELAAEADKKTDILIFHADLKGAKYNVLENTPSAGTLSIEDLCPGKYRHCIGGHIHLQQNVGRNVWYVGSPFATDWGEANQKKGYLLFDSEQEKLIKIPSTIPHWFDPQWPGFWEPMDWKGARVRIKVPVGDSKHIQEELRSAKEKAERKYSGAEIIVVPDIQSSTRQDSKIRIEHSDTQKISIYAEETLPEELKAHKEKIIKFLVEQLNQVGGLQRAGGELKFTSLRGENVLSFKKLEMALEPGLCVVTGKNLDRKGKSNGSGKTSYLQLLAIALFGTTFKGQKHNAWMHRWAKKGEKAYAKVWFQDSKGRPCNVRRSRQPVDLRLTVNGEILESGNRPEETQKLIEQITGYTWETLSNAVYIDQTQAHLMLTGTEAQRKEFLARLQNLERFEKALKRVKDQKYEVELGYKGANSRIAEVSREVESLDLTISQTRAAMAQKGNPVVLWKRKKEEYETKKRELDDWEKLAAEKTKLLNKKIDSLREREQELVEEYGTINGKQKGLEEQRDRLEGIEGTCPTCQQTVPEKHQERCRVQIDMAIMNCANGLAKVKEKLGLIRPKIREVDDRIVHWGRNKKLAAAVGDLRNELTECRERKEQWEGYEKLIGQLTGRKKKLLYQKELETEKARKSKKWLSVIKYAETVFARNGLPAYLNSQICPQLNQAAEKYAELFTQREIQVQFAVDEDGRMDVQVINANGGAEVEDQSEGEMKVASLITSFAVREVAPKTNLLILDEPGDGLDALSARQFARGLKSIANKFGTILLTSHNPNILSELASERMITVEKKDGVSEVVDG